MTTTATAPAAQSYLHRPCISPTSGLAIWWLVPLHVRTLLRATVPTDARQHGCGTESLVVPVGPGVPLRWLQVNATDSGELDVRLWEVRRTGIKGIGAEVCKSTELPALLTRWAKSFGLSG